MSTLHAFLSMRTFKFAVAWNPIHVVAEGRPVRLGAAAVLGRENDAPLRHQESFPLAG